MSYYIKIIKLISLAFCTVMLTTILPSCHPFSGGDRQGLPTTAEGDQIVKNLTALTGANKNLVDTVYPVDANLINVRDYGAKGNGSDDDTAAIIQAVRNNLTEHRTIFFPAGTYLVSDTIDWKKENGVFGAFLTWQGEGAKKTTIKLKNNASGFDDPQKPKAIVRSGSLGVKEDGKGNRAHNNYIFDLTFDVGKNNPGAIGVDFNASNTGAMENVAIVSRDKKGAIGLNLTREVGPCLVKNLTIKGFDIGIKGGSALYNVVLENIYLENQNKVGIDNEDLVLSIRHLTSVNKVPAISNGGNWSGPIVAIDSQMRGGSSENAAIINNSKIFVRNIQTEGYKAAIQNYDRLIENSQITEFVEPQVLDLFDSSQTSLNLPIEDTPTFVDNNSDNWANVSDFGALPGDGIDDSVAIQQAIDSGKTTIYFPYGRYKVEKAIAVRGAVHRLIGFHSWISSPDVVFRFENQTHPVILERFNFDGDGGKLENKASQPVVVKHSIGPTLLTTSDSTWFVENVVAKPISIGGNQKLYARQLNIESPPPTPMIENDGGLVWLLGYKTEFGNTVAATLNGGKTEILGGLFYPAQGVKDPQIPVLLIQDSAVSATYREIAFGSTYTIQIEETRGGESHTLMRRELGEGKMVGVPLYVGH